MNSSTDNKNVDSSKLKTFADENSNLPAMMELDFDKVDSIVGKGEHVFSPFLTMF